MNREIEILNPAEFLEAIECTEVVHRDGSRGRIIGVGDLAGHVRVRFDDGLETDQPLTFLQLPGMLPPLKVPLKKLVILLPKPEAPKRVRNSQNKRIESGLVDSTRATITLHDEIINLLRHVAWTDIWKATRLYEESFQFIELFNSASIDSIARLVDESIMLYKLNSIYTIVDVRIALEVLRYANDQNNAVPSLYQTIPLLSFFGEASELCRDVSRILEDRIYCDLQHSMIGMAHQTYKNNSAFLKGSRILPRIEQAKEQAAKTLIQEIETKIKTRNEGSVSTYDAKAKAMGINLDLRKYYRLESDLNAIDRCLSEGSLSGLAKLRVHIQDGFSNDYLNKKIAYLNTQIAGRIKGLVRHKQFTYAREVLEQHISLVDRNRIKNKIDHEEQTYLAVLAAERVKKNLDGLISRLLTLRVETKYLSEGLSDTCARLTLLWAGKDPYQFNHPAQAVQQACSYGDYNLAKMWSARNAEVVAQKFLQKLDYDVSDIAAHQLTGESRAWKFFDIEASGEMFDVKNARSSLASKNNYSDICVPSFKKKRIVEEDVNIFGVFSKYLKAEQMGGGEKSEITVLGSVSQRDIFDLERVVGEISNNVVQVTTLTRSHSPHKFLPGWLFDYPLDLYYEPDRCASEISCLLKDWEAVNLDHHSLPKPILLLELVHGDHPGTKQTDLEAKAVEVILDMIRMHGASLRSIVMGVILACIRCACLSESRFSPNDLKSILYFDTTEKYRQFPAAVYDPLEYVNNYIDVFERIYSHNRTALVEYASFRLQGANILQGMRDGGSEWETIIAYCGGKSLARKTLCGKNPIFFGESFHCTSCYKLICTECGFCSNKCPKCKGRQEQMAEVGSFGQFDDDIPF